MTGTIVTNYPASVAEANAALKLGVFDHGWLCDEAGGDLLPAFGGLALTAGGSGIAYGLPGPAGAGDGAVGFGAPRTGQFGGGQAFDVAATDDLLVAWVGLWTALPTAFGTMFGKVAPSFTQGWAVSGTDGTQFNFGLGAGSTAGIVIAGTSAFQVGSWHVGVAAVDRATGRAGVGTRSLAGVTVSATNTNIGAQSLSTASAFFVGKSDWVSANDTFELAALYIGKSPGAAAGVPTNLPATLLNFHTYVTRSDNYKAKVMRRQLPPPYKRDFGAVIPAILTVIGQSDNLIGGLFGSADFLPDEG